jgi:hypothetical protein
LVGIEAVPAICQSWSDLCTRAVEENVYYSPSYARALLDNLPSKDVGFATVWKAERLVALLPVTLSPFSLSPLTPSQAWLTPYTFSCTPLLDRDLADDAARALLELLAQSHDSEWHLPMLNVDGPACLALTTALREAGICFDHSANFERAALTRSRSFEDYLAKHLSAHRRKDLQRNRRRLETLGSVAHVIHTSGVELKRAVETFLSIEASGWKGEQGTALASDPHTRRFAEQAFTNGDSRVDLLTLNGVAIAAGVVVFSGNVGFTVKCAYDERYRSYSAGLLLELEVIRSFLQGDWAERLDGGTLGAHVIDELWTDRIQVADLLLSFSTLQPKLRLATLKGWIDIKREVKQAINREPIGQYIKRFQLRLRRLGVGQC